MIDSIDALVVGAGFAGLRALHTLRQSGKRVQVIEASDDVGGSGSTMAIPAPDATLKAMTTPTAFRQSSNNRGAGASVTPRSRKSSATSAM